MKKLFISSLVAAFVAAFSLCYPTGPVAAQINVTTGISQETSDAIVSLMSRWNTALSDASTEGLLEVYVPEDREYVQEIIRGRGKAVGTGVDVRAIERIGPDGYRVRFVRFWGGAKPGRANVSVEVVQVGDKLLLKVPAAQKAALSQRTTPAAVTPVPEPPKPKVAEIATPPAPEVPAKAAVSSAASIAAAAAPTASAPTAPEKSSAPAAKSAAPAPAKSAALPAAPAVKAEIAPPAAPVTPSAAAPVVVEPKAPRSPVAPLVVTTDTKPRVAEPTPAPAPAAPAAAPASADAKAVAAAPAAASATAARPAAEKAAATAAAPASKVRLGPGVDQQAADGLTELMNRWNDAIAEVNTTALVALHAPEDKEAVEKIASSRAKSVDSKISLTSIDKISDNTFRVRFVRSWGGARGGKAANAVDAELRDGKYLLRANKAQVAAAAKRPATATATTTAAASAPITEAKAEKPAEPAATPPATAAASATPAASQQPPAPIVSATSQPAAPAKTEASASAKPAAAAAPVKKAAPTRSASTSNVAKVDSKATATTVDGSAPALNPDGSVRYVFAKIGHATLIKLPISATRIAVGDPNILDFTMINSRELYVLGKSVGTTNMILWESSGRSITLPAAVNVDLEPLSASIRASLPQEQDVKISSIAGSIILSGTISDGLAARSALNLADAFVSNLNRQILAAGAQASPGTSGGQSVSTLRVIDLMRLRDSQQVMLEVKIAEIQKTLLEQLGVNLTKIDRAAGGSTSYTIFSKFPIDTTTTGGLKFTNSAGLTIDIDAEKRDDFVKILAEPTIVAMSGQEGSFLAGGTIFVSGGQSSGGVPAPPVEKEYGVGLKFLPTVLDGGRINLRVAPEVSELATSPVGGYPAFLSRKIATTVQLRSGQSLLIGGLLRNNLTQAVAAFPVLGELPIIGALFRSSNYKNEKTELVVIVSPSVVRASESALPAPTDNFVPPSRTEFFLEGSMERK